MAKNKRLQCRKNTKTAKDTEVSVKTACTPLEMILTDKETV